MTLGKYNRVHLQLTKEVSQHATTAEAVIAGPHVILPCDGWLESVRMSAYSIEATSSIVFKVYAGAAITGTAVLNSTGIVLTDAILTGVGTVLNPGVKYTAGQEFCFSQAGTNAKDLIGLCVQLTFRAIGKNKKRLVVLHMSHEATITGDTNENDLAGKVTLGFPARLKRVDVSAHSVASNKHGLVQVYAGANKTAGTAVLSSTGSVIDHGVLTAKNQTVRSADKKYAAGQAFCMSEDFEATSNVVGLSVQLTFEEIQALS
jgi:hypothetical protein